jgi:hypothetical protein
MALRQEHLELPEQVLHRLVPEASHHATILRFIGESIIHAHALAPDRWGLTLRRTYMRLNVGMIEVVAVLSRRVRCVLDDDTMPDELNRIGQLDVLQNMINPMSGFYKSVAGSVLCHVPFADCEMVLPLLHESHHVLLEHASVTRIHPATMTGHTPSAVAFLSTFLARSLPQPAYASM